MITPQSAAAGCKVVKTSEEPAWEQRELPSAPGTHQQRSTTVPYRSLIYDANLGCLRFSRHSAGGGPGGGGARGTAAAAADYCISAGSPQHGAENFRRLLLPESISSSLASCRQQRNKARHQYHNDDADECSDVQDSGDSSPTCVIGNAAMLCSSSTSPSLSSLSKATSIDMDHHPQAASDVYSVEVKELISKNCSNGASLLHLDQGGRNDHEPVFYSPSRNEMLLLKQGRGNKKLLGLMDTPGKPGVKGGGFGKRLESKETSSSSNWASVHNTLHLVDATAANEVAFVTKNSLALRDTHSSKEAQTMPFKSIQSPSSMMDQKSSSAAESENWKKKTGASTGMIVSAAGSQPSTQQQPGSVLNGSGSIFSFNSTHSARATADAAAAAAEGYDYDSKFEKDSSSASFDFNRASGAHRAVTAAVGPLLKPTPSKWDDAQKWLSASDQAPGNATAKPISKCKSGPMQQQQGGGGATIVSTKKVTFSNLGAAVRQSATPNGGGGAATTHLSKPTNAVAENCGGRDAPSSSAPSVELIEGSVAAAAAAGTAMSRGGGAVDRYPLNDLYEGSSSRSSPDASDKSLKPARLRTAKPTSESATEGWVESLADYPGAAADSSSSLAVNTRGGGGGGGGDVVVSTRDMGTEMTPIASVDPSRTATPLRATTPNLGSPINSRPSSPDTRRVMTVPSSTPTSESKKNSSSSSSSSSSCSTGVEKQEATDKRHSHDHCMMQSTTTTTPSSSSSCTTTTSSSTSSSSSSSKVLSSKELQAKTRQEILALGTQLGKANIAAWATKEEEEADAAKALKTSMELEEVRKSLHSSRATAWEEAEQAKYAARYKREEAKIQAWENHEKAKAEAEMRRIEVKVERMWSHANEKLMNKLAAAHRQAEDLRAAAEARKSEQIAKAASRAEYIRGTGKMPTSFFARFC
ncbi:hypothetical protein BDL97_10G042400 [Sphagnum fallax]|nr:hypothetical protein BDL97_10G042400 [Sphagnum fallax]